MYAGGDKPDVGQGLNRPAEVTLHGVFKRDRDSGQPLRDAASVDAYVKRLKKLAAKQSSRFLDYNAEQGTWRFEVEHFSRCGRLRHSSSAALRLASLQELHSSGELWPAACSCGHWGPMTKGRRRLSRRRLSAPSAVCWPRIAAWCKAGAGHGAPAAALQAAEEGPACRYGLTEDSEASDESEASDMDSDLPAGKRQARARLPALTEGPGSDKAISEGAAWLQPLPQAGCNSSEALGQALWQQRRIWVCTKVYRPWTSVDEACMELLHAGPGLGLLQEQRRRGTSSAGPLPEACTILLGLKQPDPALAPGSTMLAQLHSAQCSGLDRVRRLHILGGRACLPSPQRPARPAGQSTEGVTALPIPGLEDAEDAEDAEGEEVALPWLRDRPAEVPRGAPLPHALAARLQLDPAQLYSLHSSLFPPAQPPGPPQHTEAAPQSPLAPAHGHQPPADSAPGLRARQQPPAQAQPWGPFGSVGAPGSSGQGVQAARLGPPQQQDTAMPPAQPAAADAARSPQTELQPAITGFSGEPLALRCQSGQPAGAWSAHARPCLCCVQPCLPLWCLLLRCPTSPEPAEASVWGRGAAVHSAPHGPCDRGWRRPAAAAAARGVCGQER